MILVTEITYHIGIVGCGKMGNDLFEFFKGFDLHVTWVCKEEASVNDMQSTFCKNQTRALKYKLTDQEQYEFRLKNTTITTELNQLINCDLIIETITEDINLKRDLFRQLETIIPKDCIIASNTSSISPNRLFRKTLYPERCLGLHFFYPIKMKDFVEVNMADNTSEDTLETLKSFLRYINKYALVLRGEEHFLINRIFLKMQAGCCRLVTEKGISYREIDKQVKAGLFPVGVFEFLDHVGIDVMLQSVKNYMSYESDPLFYQPMIDMLEAKITNGQLGKKTAAGFYDYTGKKDLAENKVTKKNDALLRQIENWFLDGVYYALSTSVCTKNELNKVVQDYMMAEKKPFDLAEEIGYTPK